MADISSTRRFVSWIGLVLVLLWLVGVADAALPSGTGSPPDSDWLSAPATPFRELTWGMGRSFGGTTVTIGSAKVVLPPIPPWETESELRLYQELAGRKETERNLLLAAADASGLTAPDAVARFEKSADQAWTRIERTVGDHEEPLSRANALLKALHREVLRSYQKDQPYPSVALKTGLYNCVSATVLYNVFARRLGLRTAAVGEPDHVFSVVIVGDREYGVRTTTSDGVARLLDAKESQMVVPNGALMGMALEDRLAFNQDHLPADQKTFDESAFGIMLALWRRDALLSPGDRRVQKNYATTLHDVAVYFHRAGQPEPAFSLAHQEVASAETVKARQSARLDLAIATGDWMQRLFKVNAAERAIEVFDLAYATAQCSVGTHECADLDHETTIALLNAADRYQNGPAVPEAQVMHAVVTRLMPTQLDFVTKASLLAAQHLWTSEGRKATDAYLRSTLTSEVCGAQPHLRCDRLRHWAAMRWLAFSPVKALLWLWMGK